MPTIDDGKLYEQKPDPRDDKPRRKANLILIIILLSILALIGIWHLLGMIAGVM
jgi:hypothetical protein